MNEVIDVVAGNALICEAAARDAATRQLAADIGYELPTGRIDPEFLIDEACYRLRRIPEDILMAGKAFLIAKESVGYGKFIEYVEMRGVNRRIAAGLMNAARKIGDVRTSGHLIAAAGNASKLLELALLDHEQLDELAETGQTGDLKLDDVDRMGFRELRKAVRELRAKGAAKDKVIDEKSATINRMQEAAALAESGENQGGEEPAPHWFKTSESLRRCVSDTMHDLFVLQHSVGDLLAAMPDGPARNGMVYSAFRELFGMLRETAQKFGVPVGLAGFDDEPETADPDASDEAIGQLLNQQNKAWNSGINANRD